MSQTSLFDTGIDETAPCLARYADGLIRQPLSDDAWLELRPGWVGRPDLLLEYLIRHARWRAERRQMYDRVLDVPRLLSFHGPGQTWPHPLLHEMRAELSAHYRAELGEDCVTAGMCLYRDGRDSVAWHGDRIGRGQTHDTMVAIVSLGATRRLALRPRGGGQSLQVPMGAGDVVVMGGSCQRTWEHAVPKTTQPVGPRLSIQFRVAGVR